MKVLIIATGYASRFYPLTDKMPESLLKLRDLTILDNITSQLETIEDIDKIYIVSGHGYFNYFTEWFVRSIKAHICGKYKLISDGSKSFSERPGAVADIREAIESQNIDDDLLVITGDNFFDFDLRQFMDFARAKKPFHTVCLYRAAGYLDLCRYGIAELNCDGQICSFEEKPEAPGTNLISTCIYFFPREKLHLVKQYLNSGFRDDDPGSYVRWLVFHDKVFGNVSDGMRFNLGDFEDLGNALVYLHGQKSAGEFSDYLQRRHTTAMAVCQDFGENEKLQHA